MPTGPNVPKISAAEWEVMRVVWHRPPVTANEGGEALADHKDWSPRTIRTLLNRLVKKRALRFEQQGKSYLYRPAVTQAECIRRESRSFAERVFDGRAAPMLVHLVRNAKLAPEEIAELRKILRDKQKG